MSKMTDEDELISNLSKFTWVFTLTSVGAAWWAGWNPFLWGMVAFFGYAGLSFLFVMANAWADRRLKARANKTEEPTQ